MRDMLCVNVRRKGDQIPVMELTMEEILWVLTCADSDLQAALTDNEDIHDVRLRFEIERTRRELGL